MSSMFPDAVLSIAWAKKFNARKVNSLAVTTSKRPMQKQSMALEKDDQCKKLLCFSIELPRNVSKPAAAAPFNRNAHWARPSAWLSTLLLISTCVWDDIVSPLIQRVTGAPFSESLTPALRGAPLGISETNAVTGRPLEHPVRPQRLLVSRFVCEADYTI